MQADSRTDVAIVGAGAAGLATAIFVRRAAPHLHVTVFDGARLPGAKILVSGGSRCNVTNVEVTERDFNGGRPTIIRRVLRAFPSTSTIAFFRDLGVSLHEEPGGKLFPDTNRSRDVLDALLGGIRTSGVRLQVSHRVHAVTRRAPGDDGFDLETSAGRIRAEAVVLATGGLSLPKTGSDGHGYQLAQRLGHSLVPTTPALVPLRFAEARDHLWRTELAGVSHPVRLRTLVSGRAGVDVDGAMLWTHFGISGPAVLDISRHWLRHRLEGVDATLTANLLSDDRFDEVERQWLALANEHPRQLVVNRLATLAPAAVARAAMTRSGVDVTRVMGELPRDERRALLHTMTAWPLPVVDSRGYAYAEVTAGGVNLTEIDPATMQSRVASGLFLVGEVLDVDGRLGGFNFQWAWSSAYVAARGIAATTGR